MKPAFYLNGLALGVVTLAGLLCLPMPFWGDQALFTAYARQLTEGAVLYRDVFDVKQPGIFLFYAAGGLLFGFTEVGIHLFELAWWLAFSVFSLVALRPYFTTRWAPPLVPVFTVVTYYFGAGLLDQAQIEILVAFPLLLAWWLIDQAAPGTRAGVRRYAAAGLVAATVVLLKHLYLLIVVAFLGYAAVRSARRGIDLKAISRSLVAFTVALALPLILTGAYFAAYGQLGRIWWAYFEMAPAAQLLTPRPLGYLITGVRKFMIGHAPLLILAVLGCVAVRRDRDAPRLKLVHGMLLWAAAGVIAFPVLQGWPEYKWPLFTVPVGILAVVGAETLAALARTVGWRPGAASIGAGVAVAIMVLVLGAREPQLQTRLLLAVVTGGAAGAVAGVLTWHARTRQRLLQTCSMAIAVALGLTAIVPVNKVRTLMAHGFALTSGAREDFQRAWNHTYRAADEDLAILEQTEPLPGAIFVFGDPIVLLRSARPQAVPILGWGPEFLDRKAWQQLHADLAATLPPYIVVNPRIERMIRDDYPPMMELIESRYDVAFVGATGTWYVVREPQTSQAAAARRIP